jgi:hypothetical protein
MEIYGFSDSKYKDMIVVEQLAASILYSALHIEQCYMSTDSSCISNCADIHSYTKCCYNTVNCEKLIYCNIPAFM